MTRQKKSSLANGGETRGSRKAQLEVQREVVATTEVPVEHVPYVEESFLEENSQRPAWSELDAPPLSDVDLGRAPPELRPVELSVRRDHTLVVQALEHRASEIEKLAKKNDDEGYPREARVQKSDAAQIREMILPKFKPFIELPLVTPGQLQYGIKNALRPLVHRAITKAAKAGDVHADVTEAESALENQLAIRIGTFVREVSERSFAAGVALRESEADVLAEQSLEALASIGGEG